MIHPTGRQLIHDADKPLIINQLIDSPVNYYQDVNQSKNGKMKAILILAFIFMCVIRLCFVVIPFKKSNCKLFW